MASKLFVVLLLTVSLVGAHLGCGTPSPSAEKKRENHLAEREILAKRTNVKRDTIWVAVDFHEILWGTGSQLAAGELDLLINVANTAFLPVGVQFYKSYYDTYDAYLNGKYGWYNLVWASSDDREMRAALRIGGNRNLNIYFMNLQQYAGVSAFPWWYADDPLIDGIVLKYDYFTSSHPATNYKTMFIHEIGHWLGLYHTFDGGCSDTEADYVLDTPAEAEAHYDCTQTDSCPNLPGYDPIWNFMDYALWNCQTNMTLGQIQRMTDQTSFYRNDVPFNGTDKLTTGALYTTAYNGCPTNGYMRCYSLTQFQTCNNGYWGNAVPCATNTYCNPNGNYIYCGYTSPTTTTTTTSSTTAALTTSPATTQALTTNNVQGAQIVIESPKSYQVSLSTNGSADYWIDTAPFTFGIVQTGTMSWGVEQGKKFQKEDGQYDDSVDPTISHVWTTLTSINGTNFFPSNDQIPAQFDYTRWTGEGAARWRSEGIFFGSDFYILGTDLKVWDSNGVLRGHGSRTNLNILMDWPQSAQNLLQLDTFAPMNYSGNPINTKVTFELLARRVNNQPVTSRSPSVTSRGLTSSAMTSKALTTQAAPLTSAAVTSRALTTGASPVTTRAFTSGATPATTASASATCTVGATRCVTGGYQTCVYAFSSGGWVGNWGANQSCPAGTNCVQYNGYIGCS